MTAPPDPRNAEGGAAATRTPPGGPNPHHGVEDRDQRTTEDRQWRRACQERRRMAAYRLEPMPGYLAADGLAGRDPLVGRPGGSRKRQ